MNETAQGTFFKKQDSNMAPLKFLSSNVMLVTFSGFDLHLSKLQEWKCDFKKSISAMCCMRSVSISFWSCVSITTVGRVLFIQRAQPDVWACPAASQCHSSLLTSFRCLWVKDTAWGHASSVYVCLCIKKHSDYFELNLTIYDLWTFVLIRSYPEDYFSHSPSPSCVSSRHKPA